MTVSPTEAPPEPVIPELTLNPDVAFSILLKAREFDAKVAETDPDSGSNPSDDGSIDALEFGPRDATQAELASAINDLNDDEQGDLIALICLGRGDFTLDEWAMARQFARDIDRAHAAGFVFEIPLVSDYLDEGLSQCGRTLEDYVDRT
jgi:hypothetical protein